MPQEATLAYCRQAWHGAMQGNPSCMHLWRTRTHHHTSHTARHTRQDVQNALVHRWRVLHLHTPNSDRASAVRETAACARVVGADPFASFLQWARWTGICPAQPSKKSHQPSITRMITWFSVSFIVTDTIFQNWEANESALQAPPTVRFSPSSLTSSWHQGGLILMP